jgi:hypothetical protein
MILNLSEITADNTAYLGDTALFWRFQDSITAVSMAIGSTVTLR